MLGDFWGVMRMAADHNFNFPYGGDFAQQSFCNQRAGAANISSGVAPGGGVIATTGMMMTGSPNSSKLNTISSLMSAGNPPAANPLLDPAPGLKHRTKFAVDWSNDELELLKQGIARYADEPTIMKYIKLAAMLPDKTVRDVAMRCRWMTKKESSRRRKPEDPFAGKKIKDRKDKLIVASPVPPNMQRNQQDSAAAAYSFMTHGGNPSNQFACEAVPVIDSRTQQLMNDNIKLLHQIAVNLEFNEIQNNIDLLCRSKENIMTILNSMSGMPGIMSRMPPLPVHINGNLIDCISPCTINLEETGNGSRFKEEPGCW